MRDRLVDNTQVQQKSESGLHHDQVPPLLRVSCTTKNRWQANRTRIRSRIMGAWEALCKPSFATLTTSTKPVWISRLEFPVKFSLSDTLHSDKPAESKSESEQSSSKD